MYVCMYVYMYVSMYVYVQAGYVLYVCILHVCIYQGLVHACVNFEQSELT
jgi:hypothetical protein